ncbi:uncharacterized protein LOC128200888 [Galleria mellonella]|uniref:Uncharacterized protein LOC128200888 n=1 Tax=Galleria mellonella TaxID=7137 RepID=A0ABM3MJZ1_GALME|nr:uncharacterized protein LOC128200888 [Galleria mellonella]
MANNIDSIWHDCPSDILLKIFAYLDYNSLINCLVVNKKWMALSKYLVKCIGYNEITKKGIYKYDKYKMKFKENTEPWQLIINCLLWFNLQRSNVQKIYEYEMDDIKHICICKDKIVVRTSTSIGSFSIVSHVWTQIHWETCVHYEATKYLTVIIYYEYDGNKMVLHGKSRNTTEIEPLLFDDLAIRCILVEEKYLLVLLDDGDLWRMSWNEIKWESKLIAKNCGNGGTIVTLHLHQGWIYGLCHWGSLYSVNMNGGSNFEKLCDFNIPDYASKNMNPVFFDKCSIVVSVPSNMRAKYTVVMINDAKYIMLERPGLTCATTHGEMLLLGYENGKVEFYAQKSIIRNDPPNATLYLTNVVTPSHDDLAIIGLDVYESNASHHLFIATRHNIYEILLSH